MRAPRFLFPPCGVAAASAALRALHTSAASSHGVLAAAVDAYTVASSSRGARMAAASFSTSSSSPSSAERKRRAGNRQAWRNAAAEAWRPPIPNEQRNGAAAAEGVLARNDAATAVPSQLPAAMAHAAQEAVEQLEGGWNGRSSAGWRGMEDGAASAMPRSMTATASATVASTAPSRPPARFWHPLPELRPAAQDALVHGQAQPLHWLLAEIKALLPNVRERSHENAGELRLGSSGSVIRLLTELHELVLAAPTHPANRLSLVDFRTVFLAIDTVLRAAAQQTVGAAAAATDQPSSTDLAVSTSSMQQHARQFALLLIAQSESLLPVTQQLHSHDAQSTESPARRESVRATAETVPLLRVSTMQLYELLHVADVLEALSSTPGSQQQQQHLQFTASTVLRLVEQALAAADAAAAARTAASKSAPRGHERSFDEQLQFLATLAEQHRADIDAIINSDAAHVLWLLDQLQQSMHNCFGSEEVQRLLDGGPITNPAAARLCQEGARLLERLRALMSLSGAAVDERLLSRALAQYVPLFRAHEQAQPLFLLLLAQLECDMAQLQQLQQQQQQQQEQESLSAGGSGSTAVPPAPQHPRHLVPSSRRISSQIVRCVVRSVAACDGVEAAALFVRRLKRDKSKRRFCVLDTSIKQEVAQIEAAGTAAAAAHPTGAD